MYDARGSGQSNTAVFGLAICGVIVAAFAAVFFWPVSHSDNANPPSTAAYINTANTKSLFKVGEEQKFADALMATDRDAYDRISKRFQNGGISDAKRYEIMLKEMETVALENIDHLVKADVKHFDAMLTDINLGLKGAMRSGSKMCHGSTLSSLGSMNQKQAEKFVERNILNNSNMREFGLKLNRHMLNAIVDGRKRPKKYGNLGAADQKEIQKLTQKIMFQPEVMSILMSANSTGDPEALMDNLNLCKLGIVVLDAVESLPSKTKGRLWAKTMADIRRSGSFNLDPSKMRSLGGL